MRNVRAIKDFLHGTTVYGVGVVANLDDETAEFFVKRGQAEYFTPAPPKVEQAAVAAPKDSPKAETASVNKDVKKAEPEAKKPEPTPEPKKPEAKPQ